MKISGVMGRQAVAVMFITGASFLMGPLKVGLLTRTLDQGEYGVQALLMVTVYFGTYMFGFGIFNHVFRTSTADIPVEEKYSILKTSLLLNAALLVLLLIFCAWGAGPLARFLGIGGYLKEFRASMAVVGLSVIMFDLVQFVQGQKKVVRYNLYVFLRANLWALFLAAGLIAGYKASVYGVMLMWVAGLLVTILFSLAALDIRALLSSRFDTGKIRGIFRYCLPLIPYLWGVEGFPVVNRYVLSHYRSTVDVAIYSAGYAFVDIAFVSIMSSASVLFPYMYEEGQKKGANCAGDTKALVNYVIAAALFAGLLLFAFSKELVLVVSGERYAPSAYIIMCLIPLPVLRLAGIVAQQRFLISGRTLLLGWIYVLGAAINVLLSGLLISAWGAVGACWAIALSYLVVDVMVLRALYVQEGVSYLEPRTGLAVAVFFAALTACGYLTGQWYFRLSFGLFAFAALARRLGMFGSRERRQITAFFKTAATWSK